jgi:mannose-1-phosphate guanylyltransferase
MFAVIMAGGSGTRFWPLSRTHRPKQFLAIGTAEPLIVETVHRLAPLIGVERTCIVAGAHHADGIRTLLPELPDTGLIIEPCARNTAPCVGLAAIHVAHTDPDAVMAVLPADHHIADPNAFRRVMAAAAERARAGEIVTLGIRPTRPETGYGYIHYDRAETTVTQNGVEVCAVRRFVEKPPKAVAEKYLADGGYLWNSGMFFFTARRILDDMRRLLPAMADGLERIAKTIGTPQYDAVLAEEFAAMTSVSIDYGIMEHAANVRVVPATIGWNDVGHWAALADFAEADAHGNVVEGPAVVIDSRDTIIHSEGRVVAVVGCDNLAVVSTDDAVLVCPRERAQDVRRVVDALKSQGKTELL